MRQLKDTAKSISPIGSVVASIRRTAFRLAMNTSFPGSREYWESRYAHGGTSGAGSLGKLAEFKSEVLNSFVTDYGIRSVIEFGCGDGNNLSLTRYPAYIGLDVSRSAISLCKARFKHDTTKSFFLYDPECFVDNHTVFKAELALSLDVIFHLVEDTIFHLYMTHLFCAAERFAIIYSSDTDANRFFQQRHIRHRLFSEWVKRNSPEYELIRRIPNRYPYEGESHTRSFSDFYFYEKT